MTHDHSPNPPIDVEAPEGAPAAGMPANHAPTVAPPPYRSSARRATVATWLLAGSTILAAMVVAADAYGIDLVQKAIGGSLTEYEATSFVDLSTAISVAVLLAYVATGVAFLAWLSRTVDNVPGLGAGWPSASPRWAIAWWFIPFANFGMPYEVVRELRARMRGDGPRQHPPLLLAWWFTFLGGEVLASVVARMPSVTLPQVSAILTIEAMGFAVTACAGVLAILVVRDIERAAAARAAIMQSGAPIPQNGSTDAWDAGGRRTGWRMRASWVGYVAITAAAAVAVAIPVLAKQPGVAAQPSATPLQHQAPELEAGLPTAVAGRSLERWSVRGEDYFVTYVGLNADDLAQVKADLAQSGLTIEDVAFAVGRPADPNDPPSFVFAIQLRGIAAETIPDSTLIDHPDAGTFTAAVIGGKSVRRGTVGMIEPSGQGQPIPYLYDKGDVRYIIVTDDAAWAADALGRLP